MQRAGLRAGYGLRRAEPFEGLGQLLELDVAVDRDRQAGGADLRLEPRQEPDCLLDPGGERRIDRGDAALLRLCARPARSFLRGADREALAHDPLREPAALALVGHREDGAGVA